MDDDPDDVEPQPPLLHPVPCMKCRRQVWVERNRSYVVCEDCTEDTEE